MNAGRLRKTASEIDVTAYINYRDYLQHIYLKMKKLDRSFSYHLFSELLGLGKSNVSWLIITGRRSLTPSTQQKIIEVLELTSHQRRYFGAMVAHDKARSPQIKERYFAQMIDIKSKFLAADQSKENLEYYSEWYHPVIRELTQLESFRSDPNWIAKKLYFQLMPKQAKESLELLEHLGLIAFSNELGRHVLTKGNITPERKVSNLAAVRFHHKMIDAGRESITSVPTLKREINTITVAISPEKMELIRQEIHQLCQKLLDIEETCETKSEVYQMNIQFFPFTKDKDPGANNE